MHCLLFLGLASPIPFSFYLGAVVNPDETSVATDGQEESLVDSTAAIHKSPSHSLSSMDTGSEVSSSIFFRSYLRKCTFDAHILDDAFAGEKSILTHTGFLSLLHSLMKSSLDFYGSLEYEW